MEKTNDLIGFGSFFWQKIVIGSGSKKKGSCNALYFWNSIIKGFLPKSSTFLPGCEQIDISLEVTKSDILKGLAHLLKLETFYRKFSLYNNFGMIVWIHKLKFHFSKYYTIWHSLEIRGLCLMKWPIEMPQNMPYFWNTYDSWKPM